jgi:hypothetical protein
LDISCFDLKGELKEDDKTKKYADMVKNLKVEHERDCLFVCLFDGV